MKWLTALLQIVLALINRAKESKDEEKEILEEGKQAVDDGNVGGVLRTFDRLRHKR